MSVGNYWITTLKWRTWVWVVSWKLWSDVRINLMRFHLHHLIINHNLRTHKHLPHHPCHVNQMLEINTKVDYSPLLLSQHHPQRRCSIEYKSSPSQGAQAKWTALFIWKDLYPALTRHLTSLGTLRLTQKKVGWRSAKCSSLEDYRCAPKHH